MLVLPGRRGADEMDGKSPPIIERQCLAWRLPDSGAAT